MVRGKVQIKASVESKDKNHDTGALTAQNVNKNAVYLEKTQTCLCNEWRGILGGVTNGGRFCDGVLIRSNSWELLNLQDSVDCEPITRMYYFAVI
ncbi:unnamed protein product [Sphagnum jensenii]|uniref:Uncharacterized protein n=1 Tax=Sphagnum jensenii TaxID=128206 RepID=A0ABP0XB30_9BRYO